MSDEDRMDALLRQMAAEEYNRPPEIVPRERMWEAVCREAGARDSGKSGDPRSLGTTEPGTGNRASVPEQDSALGLLRGCGGAPARCVGNSGSGGSSGRRSAQQLAPTAVAPGLTR